MAERVLKAQERQLKRQGKRNGDLSLKETESRCRPSPEGVGLLKDAVDRLGLSARGFHRVMRVARTLADMEDVPHVGMSHIAEAVQYRVLSSDHLLSSG